MNEEEKREYEELKSLLYTGTISQYGKRKLIDIIEKQQKEIEKLENRNKTLEIEFEIKKYCKVNELASDLIFYKNLARDYQGNCISKDKIKEKIEELKNRKIGASTGIFAVQVDILEELLGEINK